jgi:hypothetical protein
MKWVSGPPTEEGFYWIDALLDAVKVYNVRHYDGRVSGFWRATGLWVEADPPFPATPTFVSRHSKLEEEKDFNLRLVTHKDHIRIDSGSDIEDVYLMALLEKGLAINLSTTHGMGQPHYSLWISHPERFEDLKHKYEEERNEDRR